LVLSALIGRIRVPNPILARAGGMRGNANMPYKWAPVIRPASMSCRALAAPMTFVGSMSSPATSAHPLNTYDEGNSIVLDVVRYSMMFATDFHGPNEGHCAAGRDRTGLITLRLLALVGVAAEKIAAPCGYLCS
jgi:carotenoid cleavage oxygenase